MTLESARAKVDLIRFKNDFPVDNVNYAAGEFEKNYLVDHLYSSALEVTSFLTPVVYSAMERVLANLELPSGSVTAFVVNSLITMRLVVVDEVSAIVQISSFGEPALGGELSFVLGHEIGHFLLKHQSIGLEQEGGRLKR